MTLDGHAKSSPTVMRHLHDISQSQAINFLIKRLLLSYGILHFGITIDGFNSHASLADSYSCWPIIIVPYNLPPFSA